MKRLVFASLAIASVLAVCSSADAHGWKKSSCATSGYSGDCGAYSSPVSYVDQVVKGTQAVIKTRQVQKDVTKQVMKTVDEEYTYQECVTTYAPKKIVSTYYTCEATTVPYTYNVCVPEVTKVAKDVTTYTSVPRKVTCTYTVMVPTVTPVTRDVTTYQCVSDVVTTNVCVTKKISVQEIDPCTGCCRTVCKCISEMQPVTRSIMKTVPVTRPMTCNQVTYSPETRSYDKTVYDCVPKTDKVMVDVTTYSWKPMEGKKVVYQNVPHTKEDTVQVPTTALVPKKGTRKKCYWETVTEKVMVTECYTEMVPCTYTVKVAVPYTAPVDTCAPVASDCCGMEAMACYTSCGQTKSKRFGCCKK